MSDNLIEYEDTTQSGKTLYAVVRDSTGKWWNGTTTEVYAAADFANYAVAIAEQGASGFFSGATPATLPAGPCAVGIRQRAGAIAAPTDTSLGGFNAYWDGAQWIIPDASVAAVPQAVWASPSRTLSSFGFSLTVTVGSYVAAAAPDALVWEAIMANSTAYGQALRRIAAVLGGQQTDAPDHSSSSFADMGDPSTTVVTSTQTATQRTVAFQH